MKIFKYEQFINESITSSDLKVGDVVRYIYKGQNYKGTILDHFGDGVFLKLDSELYYPGGSTDSFELYDGEDNPWGNIGMIRKQSATDAFS